VGDTINFEITDDGENLSFNVEEVGDESTTISLSATSAVDFATDHIVFHNRENNNGQATFSYLDDVAVTSPSSSDPYADAVLSYLPGPGVGSGNDNPNGAFGVPEYDPSSGSGKFVSLGGSSSPSRIT